LNILLEGLPKGLNLADVTREIRSVNGVVDVHDLHIWSLSSDDSALSCHLVIDDMQTSESEPILHQVNKILAERFHIHHTTIQFEHKRCAAADMCAGGARPDPAMARGVH
jgi:cobalt-zinc-cadmium efflux system protein